MTLPEIDVAAFAAAHTDGAPGIDVRDPDKCVQGHLPGGRLVPLEQLGTQLPYLRTRPPVCVVCESGTRSRSAAEILRQTGMRPVIVRGGTAEGRAAQQPVVCGPHAA